MKNQKKRTNPPSAPRLTPIALALSASLVYSPYCMAQAQADGNAPALTEVKVSATAVEEAPSERTGSYTVKNSRSATGLNIPLKETPQSVSVVTREQMDDFKLNNLNDVLGTTTGVTVEKIETDRTYYTSRGFDITNFQIDGIGVQTWSGNMIGDVDMAIYDRVEVVKGATGLMSGAGNPSATVNFVRKRPTDKFQASANFSYGSWNSKRIDADLSTPLTESGNVRGRVVVAGQDNDSYLDRYSHTKTLFYGIVEADLSNSTTLSVGHTEERNKAKGAMWGALPLYYSDGSATHFSTSASTAADWSYWNTTTITSFAELAHRFDNDWTARFVVTDKKQEQSSKLLYIFGTPDRTTGSGLYAYPGQYESTYHEDSVDGYVSGKFDLKGRKHDLVIGANWTRSTLSDQTAYADYSGSVYTSTSLSTALSGSFAEPSFDGSVAGSDYETIQKKLYAAARFNLADTTKLITGASLVKLETAGTSYSVDQYKSDSDVTPYVGLVQDINRNLTAYASYAEIFNPQYQTDVNHQRLAPVQGNNKEVGLKGSWFDKKLNASVALFKADLKNVAESAGYNSSGYYYKGVNTHSEGFEIDVSGSPTKRMQVSAGFTHLNIKDDDGNDAKTYVPRNSLKLSTTYRVPGIEKLKVGASLNWQDDIYYKVSDSITIRQGSYTLVNLMAKYDINDKVSVGFNLNNVTNKKYLSSLYWDQSYYGAPINGTVSLNVKY